MSELSDIPVQIIAGGILIAVAAAVLAFLIGQLYGRHQMKEVLKTVRQDAVKRSRAVIGGQVGEQIAPFLPGFPCNPADVRFVGKPIDFVGFPGAAEGEPIKEILFVEVKTGNSALSRREQEIKKAVEDGRVRYVVYHADSRP